MSYTTKIVAINAAADGRLLGVRLGRLCISVDMPVNLVAKSLDVSKATVYKWFAGKTDVDKHLRSKAELYYRSLLPPDARS